mmetsp:Transcript_52911/g.134220  ORF Transcript_52911/g.134220 Transcript_52911/m.134220 type:complete len:312 (-) Transcript_52911:433-1368(-)
MAVISLTLDAPDMPLNQPMKITITSPSQATHAAADWALLAPFLQQQFGELHGKFAQGFEGCTTADFVQEACGMSTPSTSASLSPRFDSLCSSPPRSPAGLMPTPGLAPSAPPGIFKVPATPSAPPGIFVAPSIPSAPPGIFLPAFRPPPGLPHPLQQSAGVGVDTSDKPDRDAYDKKSSIEWCIQGVFKKLKSSCGCPLVSPPWNVAGCDDLRVHFLPGQAWAASQRSHKGSKFLESETSAPVNGLLRLKLDGRGEGVRIKFCLFVGPVRQGPFECDFAERAVHEIPLNMNWSKHLEVDGQNLRLRLQLID